MIYNLKIVDWEKFYPKRNQKYYYWMKLQNDIFDTALFTEFTNNEKLIYLYLLTQASKTKNNICISDKQISQKFDLKISEVEKVLNSLIDTYTCCTVTTPRIEKNRKEKNTAEAITKNLEKKDQENHVGSLTEPDGSTCSFFEKLKPVEILNVWNEHRGDKLPLARSITGKRARAADALLRQNGSLEYWVSVVKRMSLSSFLAGSNKTNWKCGFDFFLKPDTHVKVMEGLYDDPKKNEIGKPKEWDV